ADLEAALATSNVVVATGKAGAQPGDITVAAGFTWASNNSLTLNAFRNIVVNNGVVIANTGAGSLTLRADATSRSIGTVTFNGTGKVDYSGSTGQVTILYNPTSFATPTDYTLSVLFNPSTVNQVGTFMLVNNLTELANIALNIDGDYALGRNIDASASAAMNGGAGFIPIL